MLYANKLYIVSSLGRSGSSLLYETITESNLKKDKNNYFWKTHYNAKEIMNTAITNKKHFYIQRPSGDNFIFIKHL